MDNLLDTKISNTVSVREAEAIVFIHWVLKKVNSANLSPKAASELSSLGLFYPGRTMDDDTKISIMKKMISVGISL